MLRRAALAQLLAQGKRLIVLDEPFIGLDKQTASEIVLELQAVLHLLHVFPALCGARPCLRPCVYLQAWLHGCLCARMPCAVRPEGPTPLV